MERKRERDAERHRYRERDRETERERETERGEIPVIFFSVCSSASLTITSSTAHPNLNSTPAMRIN